MEEATTGGATRPRDAWLPRGVAGAGIVALMVAGLCGGSNAEAGPGLGHAFSAAIVFPALLGLVGAAAARGWLGAGLLGALAVMIVASYLAAVAALGATAWLAPPLLRPGLPAPTLVAAALALPYALVAALGLWAPLALLAAPAPRRTRRAGQVALGLGAFAAVVVHGAAWPAVHLELLTAPPVDPAHHAAFPQARVYWLATPSGALWSSDLAGADRHPHAVPPLPEAASLGLAQAKDGRWDLVVVPGDRALATPWADRRGGLAVVLPGVSRHVCPAWRAAGPDLDAYPRWLDLRPAAERDDATIRDATPFMPGLRYDRGGTRTWLALAVPQYQAWVRARAVLPGDLVVAQVGRPGGQGRGWISLLDPRHGRVTPLGDGWAPVVVLEP